MEKKQKRITGNSYRDKESLLSNPWYKLYNDKKQEILQRYPPIKERTREQHQLYMKEIGDLLWEQNGPFQEFVWETMSDQEKLFQDRKARGGRKKYTRAEDEENI